MLAKIQIFFSNSLQVNEQSLEERLQLASAALLIELMLTDSEAHQKEEDKVKQLLIEQFSLSAEAIDELIALAHEEVNQSSDLYQFTRLINDNYDYPVKCKLIENLWQIAYADNELDKYEEYTIRKIADLIYVSHSDFLKAKRNVLDNRPTN